MRVRFIDVDPGAFVRQVLSLMCTVSVPWDLAGGHPEVRAMVLGRQAGSLPDGMGLYLTLYCGPSARIVGPSLVIDRPTGRWQWLLEVAYPPLATVLTLAGDAEPPPLLDISEFTTVAPERASTMRRTLRWGSAHADAGRLPS